MAVRRRLQRGEVARRRRHGPGITPWSAEVVEQAVAVDRRGLIGPECDPLPPAPPVTGCRLPTARPRGTGTLGRAGAPCLAAQPLFALALANGGDALRQRDFKLRLRPRLVVEVRQRHARERAFDGPFD